MRSLSPACLLIFFLAIHSPTRAMPPKIDATIQEAREAAFTPEYRLWLAVTKSAVMYPGTQAAQEYLFDEDNPFFDFVCACLDVSPDTARESIKRALARRHRAAQVESLGAGIGEDTG